MKIHYINACEFKGYFSEVTADKEKVTCSRCRNKHRLEAPKKKAYLVSQNGYMNVVDIKYITSDMKVLSALTLD